MLDERGQTGTEYVLLLAVLVLAIVAGAWAYAPVFMSGSQKLGQDVSRILAREPSFVAALDGGGGLPPASRPAAFPLGNPQPPIVP